MNSHMVVMIVFIKLVKVLKLKSCGKRVNRVKNSVDI